MAAGQQRSNVIKWRLLVGVGMWFQYRFIVGAYGNTPVLLVLRILNLNDLCQRLNDGIVLGHKRICFVPDIAG